MRWMLGFLKPYRRHFWPAMIALFLTSGLALAFPFFMSQLLADPSADVAGNHLDSVAKNIDRIALTLAACLAVQAFIAFWRIGWFTRAGESGLADIRRQTYGRLVRLPMAYFGEHRVGELSSRISSDLTMIRDTLITTVPQMIRHSVMLVGGLVFIFLSSVKLALFMVACIPAVVLCVALFGRRVRQFSKQAQDELANSQVVVEETLQGIANVKAFTNESHEESRYGKAIDRFLGVTMRGARSRAFFVSFIIFALFGVITLVVWFGAKMLHADQISPGQFYQLILFSIFVGASLGSLPEILSQIQNARGATARIREILEQKPEPTAGDPRRTPRLKGAVDVRSVRFAYPSRPDIEVLKGLSFDCQPGERVALVGTSGAGKSTLISLLLQFYQPGAGSILFDGKPASEYDLGHLRAQMAMVPQEVLLFGGSIRENIAYGRPGANDAEIEEAARSANAHQFISDFPEGYETLVGDRGVKLSGGQRQRVAIARALLADPAILILDEATSSLDSESEQLVQEALEKLMEGRTSLIIAHRLATVRDADRIVVLEGGKVAESGRHEELVSNRDGLYHMLARLQFGNS